MNSYILKLGTGADAAPGALEIGEMGARQLAVDDLGVAHLAGQLRQHGAGLGTERDHPAASLRVA